MNCAKSDFRLLLLVVLVCAASVSADVTDFLVNADGTVAEQNHPRIAVAGDGGFVITWVDKRAGTADIYLQRFAPDGVPIGSNLLVNDDGGEYTYQSEPALAVDLSGLYSLVWKDYRNGSYPFGPDIYFQRFDTSLLAIESNRSVTVGQPDSLKETPDIALSPWGGGVVVWADYRNHNWDIYGQRISSDGTPFGSNFRVNDDDNLAQQHMPRVAVSPEGWFAVTWYDNRLGDDDVYAQRFDSLANPLGSNIRINSDTADDRQAFPDIATDGAGHFTVVWVDWRNGVYPANPDIYARKFDTSMMPVTDDELVNRDGTSRAQREPTIAADRRGNVAIIWSDSTGSTQTYDIMGQMIDVEGAIREVNFMANSDADSAQLHPDVALDGRNRYVTWADKRNGHFDIYASITKYNDPTLVPSPAMLQFIMLDGGSRPAPQTLTVDHFGYNSLRFQLLASHSWFTVSPISGMTPTDVTVSINTDTLPFGTYLGAITLYDIDNNDSTEQVSVRLDVSAPVLAVAEDTLKFRVFAGLDDSVSQVLTISNSGVGELNWTINESLDWLATYPVSGTNDQVVDVWALSSTLGAGAFLDFFEVSANGAHGSPDTVWVEVTAVNDQTYMNLNTDRVKFATENPAYIKASITVANAGVGALNWTAEADLDWLNLDITSGTDDDIINFTIDTAGLQPGLRTATVTLTDNAAFNPTERLPFVIDYLLPGADTVIVSAALTPTLEADSFMVRVLLTDTAASIVLPLSFDTTLISVDSVRFDPDVTAVMLTQYSVDDQRGIVNMSFIGNGADSVLVPSGLSNLAAVFYTAKSNYGLFDAGEPSDSDLAVVIVTPDGSRLHPTTWPGEVRIEAATAVEEIDPGLIPGVFTLEQNYPNPFNPSTTISFSLPQKAEVSLEIFNILGQRVLALIEETLPAGSHNVLWDGRFEDGGEAPSGVYFYRLRAGDTALTRKMILVK